MFGVSEKEVTELRSQERLGGGQRRSDWAEGMGCVNGPGRKRRIWRRRPSSGWEQNIEHV